MNIVNTIGSCPRGEESNRRKYYHGRPGNIGLYQVQTSGPFWVVLHFGQSCLSIALFITFSTISHSIPNRVNCINYFLVNSSNPLHCLFMLKNHHIEWAHWVSRMSIHFLWEDPLRIPQFARFEAHGFGVPGWRASPRQCHNLYRRDQAGQGWE